MDWDEEYEALADACIELSPYGVQVRYPSNLDLNEDDMQCALNMCRRIDAAVRGKLAEKEEQ